MEQIMKKNNTLIYTIPACRTYTQQIERAFCASLNGTHEGFTEENLTEEDGYGWS